jgi:CBS domain-containing protein
MLSGLATAKDFMSAKLVTAYSQSNVSLAVKLMVDHNIGSIIVKDNEGLVGLFTERDLLSKVLARNKKLEEPILMEVMTLSYDTLRPDATLLDAARIMTEKKGRLVVFDDGKLIGIVTATDIVREMQKSGKPFGFANSYSRRIYEEGPKTRMELIVQLMEKRRIGSVIISEGKFPRGIFTERDLLRSVLTLDFRMESKVEDYATHHLITAEEGISGLQAVELMNRQHIKRLPLTRAGEIFGIVTARDLVEGFAGSSW